MLLDVTYNEHLKELADPRLSFALAIAEDDPPLEIFIRQLLQQLQNACEALVSGSLQLRLTGSVAMIDAFAPLCGARLIAPHLA